jgi:hypothetical protein
MEKPRRPKYEPIGLTLHAMIDWLLVALAFAGPVVLGYLHHVPQTAYTWGAATIGAALNVITDYPGGVTKKLKMMWHQLVELLSPFAFIIGPWAIFGNHPASWLLSVIGFTVLVNTLSTRKVKVRH